jgi:hypothetical protein
MSVLVKLHSSELIQRTAGWELGTCGGHELRRAMSSSSGRGEHLPEAGFCAQDKPMVVELDQRAVLSWTRTSSQRW